MSKLTRPIVDFDDILNGQPKGPGPLCTVTKALRALPADQAAKVQRALDNPDIGHQTIYRALNQMGLEFRVGKDSVGRHRIGDCACGRR